MQNPMFTTLHLLESIVELICVAIIPEHGGDSKDNYQDVENGPDIADKMSPKDGRAKLPAC